MADDTVNFRSTHESLLDMPTLTQEKTVAEIRNYRVVNVSQAKKIAFAWLGAFSLENIISFGLPEIDDRYHIWRVPLLSEKNKERIGEVVIDAKTSLIIPAKSTKREILETRLLKKDKERDLKSNIFEYPVSPLRDTIAFGDSETILAGMPADSIDLIFTSPPYYNAKPEYTDYITYEEYLLKIRKVIQKCYHVLVEGRFFAINISPVLVRRANRNSSSKRIAVPFDFHRIFIEEGFEFIDDIIWVKPEGAGWATGRGRRFAADRNPLQYKPVPVTEYVLIYRKKTDRLIDWFIRNHPDKNIVHKSKIRGEYEKTNIWKIHPAHDKRHPAIFPIELAKKVIQYYSFINDVVLDPFAGIGTVGKASCILERRFVLIENNPEYIEIIRKEAGHWLKRRASEIFCLNCEKIKGDDDLF